MVVREMGSGWQLLRGGGKRGGKDAWRRYVKVPPHLREFLPIEHRGKKTITLSTGTGNKTDAKKIATRGHFDQILDELMAKAETAYQQHRRDRANDYAELNNRNE